MSADHGLIRAWDKALRSGDYKQGVGRLKVSSPCGGDIRHCCLGVLCEVAGLLSSAAPGSITYAFEGAATLFAPGWPISWVEIDKPRRTHIGGLPPTHFQPDADDAVAVLRDIAAGRIRL